MDFSKHLGKTVKARNGMPMDIIAYIPKALERNRLVVMGHDKRVRTCTIDGKFSRHAGVATCLDLMPLTKTIRMRAYRHTNGTVQAVAEDNEYLFELGGGNWTPCSQPFTVEIEA